MDKNTKKAILVVSFGTSVNETREKTIDCIEADIREANPDAFYLPGLDQQDDHPAN